MRIPGNFDRWMFNYKEGNLSAEETAYFEGYLMSNPDFAEDVEAWDNAFIRQEAVEYPHMNSLLKDKSPWANWKPWAAVAALLLSVAGGIGIGSQLVGDGGEANIALSDQQTIDNNQSALQSVLYKANRLSFHKLNLSFTKVWNNSSTNVVTTSASDAEVSNESSNALSNQSVSVNGNYTALLAIQTKKNTRNSKNKNSVKNSKSSKQLFTAATAESNYKTYAKSKRAGKSTIANRKLAADKINNKSDDFSAAYTMNPEFDATVPNIEFTKSKTSLLELRFKQFFSKIDKITGYPIALVNLRDPELVIPNRNILNFNPAFAGGAGNFRMGADYRNQWNGQGVNSQVNSLYFDSYSDAARGGIGAAVTYTNYGHGAYENMTANLYYSPKFVINKYMVFEPAVKVTMGKNRRNVEDNSIGSAIELNRGNVIDQGNPAELISNESWYKDYGLGFVLNTNWFYIGGFVDNLGGHDQRIFEPTSDDVATSPHLITGVVGFDFQSRNKKTTLSPFLTYYQHGALKEAWAGATAQFNWLTLGASYSSNNEHAASVGLKFKTFKLIYQIDQTESEFLQESFVSHNIGIRFNTKNKTIR